MPVAPLDQHGEKYIRDFGHPFRRIEFFPGLSDQLVRFISEDGRIGPIDIGKTSGLIEESDSIDGLIERKQQGSLNQCGLFLSNQALLQLPIVQVKLQMVYDLTS
jgi:hypothetical protein